MKKLSLITLVLGVLMSQLSLACGNGDDSSRFENPKTNLQIAQAVTHTPNTSTSNGGVR